MFALPYIKITGYIAEAIQLNNRIENRKGTVQVNVHSLLNKCGEPCLKNCLRDEPLSRLLVSFIQYACL